MFDWIIRYFFPTKTNLIIENDLTIIENDSTIIEYDSKEIIPPIQPKLSSSTYKRLPIKNKYKKVNFIKQNKNIKRFKPPNPTTKKVIKTNLVYKPNKLVDYSVSLNTIHQPRK